MILEKLIYERNVEVFKKYEITKKHIKMIQDMIERSGDFVSIIRLINLGLTYNLYL